MRTKSEPRAQNLEDIEDGVIKPNCFNCGKKQVRLVKVLFREGEFGALVPIKTKNYIGSCTNRECFRYCDEKLSPSWIRD